MKKLLLLLAASAATAGPAAAQTPAAAPAPAATAAAPDQLAQRRAQYLAKEGAQCLIGKVCGGIASL